MIFSKINEIKSFISYPIFTIMLVIRLDSCFITWLRTKVQDLKSCPWLLM